MARRHVDYQSLLALKSKVIGRIRNLNPTLANDLEDIRLDWYRIRNAAEEGGPDDTTEVFIYEEIGGWFGLPVDELVKELQGIKTKKIDVRINSPGGSLFDSIAIYNALVKHSAKVTTYVDSLAASGASIIAMAGDECIMMVGSQLMIHDALGVEIGNARDFREFADFLDRQSDNIVSVYQAKAGNTDTDWRALMQAETWMFAAEAVELGLADRIYSAKDEPPEEEDDEEDMPHPEMAEEEGEEDEESSEDSEEDDEEEPEGPAVEALMRKQHRLTNRGFRYAGRDKAPAPPVSNHADWTSFVDSIL